MRALGFQDQLRGGFQEDRQADCGDEDLPGNQNGECTA